MTIESNLFGALHTAGRSILQGQQRLNVVTRNVGGAGDASYSRQVAVTGGQPGAALAVSRQRDGFLDHSYRSIAGEQGYAGAHHTTLAGLEAAVGEPSDSGVAAALGRFWTAWEGLAGAAHDASARQEALGAAQALAGQINRVAADLEQQRTAMARTLRLQTAELSDLGAQVADLNQRLLGLAPDDAGAAGLADQRDALLDRLAVLGGGDILTQTNGQVTVMLGGRTLVQGPLATPLTVGADGRPAWPDGQGAALGGQMGGLVATLDDDYPGVLAELDRLADTLAAAVNQRHSAGYGLDGGTGRDLFTAGAGAAGLRVVLTDPGHLAAAAAAGATGDGLVAADIAGLRDQAVVTGSPLNPTTAMTLGQHLRTQVADLGARTAAAARGEQVSSRQLAAVDQERRAVIGVSLDEEALQLMQAQQAIAAATRVVTALDDTLNRIVNGTGRVGR